MSKRNASETTAVEKNEVDHEAKGAEAVPACEYIKMVCGYITGCFIDLDNPRDGDKGLCEHEFEAMACSLERFINRWVDEGEGLIISEARGVLYGIAIPYKNSTFPEDYKCFNLASFLAGVILDCIKEKHAAPKILKSPIEDRAEQLDDFI